MFKIGNHLSSAKGYEAMGKMAVKLGANTFAFFTRNPRGGKAKEIDPKDVEAFLQYVTEHQIQKLVAHAPYTLNPCSADPALREFAKNTFADDLKRMEYTPGNYYNFHPGSHVGQGVETGIAERLRELEAGNVAAVDQTSAQAAHARCSYNHEGTFVRRDV